MKNYEIIRLKPEDYSKCGNIWDMAGEDRAAEWYDELAAGNRVIFVYTVNGEYIGEGALVLENGDPDYTIAGRRLYLSRMIVKKEYRNRGIGGALLEHLIRYARALGYREIALGVDVCNESARHLYGKKGFDTVIFEGEDEHGRYVKLLKTL